MASDPRSRRPNDEVTSRAGGTPPRDVRPVVAIGLCLLAVVLGWPVLRGGGEPDAAPPEPVRTTARPAAPPPRDAAAIGSMPAPPRPAGPAAGSSERRPVRRAEDAVTHTGAASGAGEESETPSGIGLFPPPGTDPPKTGIMVPDDYELPPGYVRHYQVTDDGQQLRPILMFHPDFQPVDDRGRPIKLPEDRVVPPSLAPPGLPIEKLAVPKAEVPLVEHPPNAPTDPAS